MRTYGPSFTYANSAAEKAPRFVIAIIYPTESLYLTSHAGVPDVPGIVLENCLQRPSALSQRIVPDEGRSEIGAMSFAAIDRAGALTDALRVKLAAGVGLRGRQVRLYQGYSAAPFGEYGLFNTQIIQGESFSGSVHSFRCGDISREQRKSIFDPKKTTLAASIAADATVIEVVQTAGFEMVEHGLSWADAPSATVGYIRIEDEVIRYTGIADTPPRFTGCVRGIFSTRAVPHTVDVAQPQDQRTRVDEYIYLELPVPKLILALLTGELYGQAATLPDHWHLGIDGEQWVRESDFTGIGPDLWNPASDLDSFIARFAGLKKVDGKQFLEKELHQLLGTYPVIYSDGRMGIHRMNPVLADAPAIVELSENNLVSWSALQNEMDLLSNHYRVEWNHVDDGGDARFTRVTEFIDADSIGLHGKTDARVLSFKGLFGSRHTNATVRARIDAQRDRYGHPPVSMSVTALPSLNSLEVGDIVKVKLATVRDFTSEGGTTALNRSFEIQRKSEDHATGEVTFQLFGSTRPASRLPPDGDGGEGPSLPDDWYSSEGTELSTVVDITLVGDVGIIDAGIWDLPGNANLTNGGAIYYYLGDLELPDGATLRLGDNVQLRVRGHFQINGDIDGLGRGLAGQADTAAYGTTAPGLAGFFGNARGMDGLFTQFLGQHGILYATLAASATQGQYSAVPYFTVMVSSGALTGVPTDLRGTSGGAGGKVTRKPSEVLAQGGTGGAGGAGLCIVSRGLSLGLSARIDLSGADSATPPTVTSRQTYQPGAGGAGAPGALLILLDGGDLPLPDLGGRFFASTGHVGAPLLNTLPSPSPGAAPYLRTDLPYEGYADPAMISDLDLANSAYSIQYIPKPQTPVEDQPTAVPAPTDLVATSVTNGVLLTAALPPFDKFDTVAWFASSTNDRTAALQINSAKASTYLHSLAPATTRYYWVRCERGAQVSEFFPSSSTAGIVGTSS